MHSAWNTVGMVGELLTPVLPILKTDLFVFLLLHCRSFKIYLDMSPLSNTHLENILSGFFSNVACSFVFLMVFLIN